MKKETIGYNENIIEAEIVNIVGENEFKKNNRLGIIIKKIVGFFKPLMVWGIFLFLFSITIGLILSTALIGFIVGVIFILFGVVGMLLFVRTLKFFIRFRRIL